MTRSKVKSRSHYDGAHLQPPNNVPTKYQLPTPYDFQDIAHARFYSSRSLWQGQRSNQGHIMKVPHLQPLTNVPIKYQLPTPYGFRDIGRTRFYRSRTPQQGQSAKSRSHRDFAHVHCITNVPYQVSTSYTLRFLRYSLDKLFPATRPSGHDG